MVWNKVDWTKLSWVLAIEIAAIMVILAFFLPGGEDIFYYYQLFASGCLDCGFVPYFAQWILAPLSWIPRTWLWPVWTALSLGLLLALCKWSGVNPVFLMLSFPTFGQVWLGQVDVLICLGLMILFFSKNDYFRGAGLILAAIKPQISGFAVMIFLLEQDFRQVLRILVLPTLVLLISLVFFGWNWPFEWILNAINQIPNHVWRLAAGDLWPFALILLPIPLFFKGRARLEVGLLVSSLAVPIFGVYSYIVFLLFHVPGWAVLLSYIWALAIPVMGGEALRFAWLLPAALLGQVVHSRFFSRDQEVVEFTSKQ
jgi:hypothetical protein